MFDWEIWNSDFEIEREIRKPLKTDFTSEKSVLIEDFNYEIQIRISWISFLPFDWEIQKRICNTILVNISLLFANYECVCKTAVLKNCSSIPCRIFQKTRKKGNLRIDMSALKSVSDFAFDCEFEIRSLKSKFRFSNRTHPYNLYRDYSKSLTLSNVSEPSLS